jgi:hypothetical protein
MAIDMGTESQTLSVKERTWRVEIFAEAGDDPTVRAHREVVHLDGAGRVVWRERDISMVTRSLSQIATTQFTNGSATVTGGELAALIAAAADSLRQAGIAAASEVTA